MPNGTIATISGPNLALGCLCTMPMIVLKGRMPLSKLDCGQHKTRPPGYIITVVSRKNYVIQ